MKATSLTRLELLFNALGDATRLRILALLTAGEICVCHIHDTLKIPQPKASRHLAYLRKAGLVSARREGLWMHYRLAELPDPVGRAVMDAVSHALSHDDAVRRDGARLQKNTGCCVPEPAVRRDLACCAPVAHGARA